MRKVNVSSMFLVPKNIYTSMMSRINEDDAKEEIKLINREKEDGNYIEKAINFNNQQERQKNQILIKPNANNETIRTNANTDANSTTFNQNTNANTTVKTNNLDGSTNNTEMFYTPMINQTANADALVRKGQSVSRINNAPLPFPIIEENLTEKDAEGNLFCGFCKEQFLEANALDEHLLDKHHESINRLERSMIFNRSVKNEQNLDSNTSKNPDNLDDVEMVTFNETTGANLRGSTPIFGQRGNENILPSFKDLISSPIRKTSTPIQNTSKYRDNNKTPLSQIKKSSQVLPKNAASLKKGNTKTVTFSSGKKEANNKKSKNGMEKKKKTPERKNAEKNFAKDRTGKYDDENFETTDLTVGNVRTRYGRPAKQFFQRRPKKKEKN